MTERVVSTLKGKIKFEMDRSSLKRVKEDIKRLKKEMSGISNPFTGGDPSKPSPSKDKQKRQQESFEKFQRRSIENFKIQTRAYAKINQSSRDAVVSQLEQLKTREDLTMEMRRQRAIMSDNVRDHKRNTRELEKQRFVQRRITASTEQMVGAIGSAFVAADALRSVVNTGMKFEAFEKTFLAVSKDSKEAAENMEFVRQEANRLGVGLVESGKAFSRMLGAAGSKSSLEQVKELFTAASEASIAMGLSADDQAGVYRAK